jgi:hypothetical protein
LRRDVARFSGLRFGRIFPFRSSVLKHLIFAAAALLAIAPAAQAQQTVLEYYAGIDQQDLYNSRGVRLTEPCAILRQDRANVHRFGKPGQYDSADPMFGDPNARAAFGGDCAPFDGYATDRLRNAEAYVYVVVYRMPNGSLRVRFGEGAG